MLLSYLLFISYTMIHASDYDKEAQGLRKDILDRLTLTPSEVLDDHLLVARQIVTDIYTYSRNQVPYVVRYLIMEDVIDARFTFQTEDVHLNSIGSCDAENVIIKLKRGSYPAVNPDNYNFPKKFINSSSREPIHTIRIRSDRRKIVYSVKNPKPGYWYAMIYIEWEDPKLQQVLQQGLVAICFTVVYTDLQVKKEDIEMIDCYSDLTLDYSDIPVHLKCITEDTVEPMLSFNLTILNISESANKLNIKLAPLSFPTEDEYMISCIFDAKLKQKEVITFSPYPKAWHYLNIDHANASDDLKTVNCDTYYLRTNQDTIDNLTVVDLMRDDKGRFFAFDFVAPTTKVIDTPTTLTITSSNVVKTLRFKVGELVDIGGSLVIKVWLKSNKHNEFVDPDNLTLDTKFCRAVVCMDIDHSSIPLDTGQCIHNGQEKPAVFILNSTDTNSSNDTIIIPYPESGTWYLTFRTFGKEGISRKISEPTTNNKGYNRNTTISLSISSGPCVGGKCSDHGICQLNSYGGQVLSFCSCFSGYGGWDCSDDSRKDSVLDLTTSILLLTLSNLLFLVSIYVAVIRRYYTEAMMYTFTMVFSIFYHACDAPKQISYCIIRGNILQFGDFYFGIVSFWVTLLAISILGNKLRSSCQLIGASLISLLTAWNMHSIFAFTSPAIIGILVLLVSWYYGYRKSRGFAYPKSYYRIYLPIGLLLITTGLVCYAALQTESNYKVVHSVWHMIVALSIAFLLPDVRREVNLNPFLPSPGFLKIGSRLNSQGSAVTEQHAT